jgi:hypothetical protein
MTPVFDPGKTHRVIIDQTQKTWFVQQGHVYDVHGNVLGKANDLKAFSPKWYFFCHFDCSNTYTRREHLEKHIFEDHRDLCIQQVPRPEGLTEGYFQPTDKAVQRAAQELADQIHADERPFVASDVSMQVPRKIGRPSKADKALNARV